MTEPDARPGLTPAAQRAAALRLRQCALTREEKPVEALIRFVLGPDGSMAPDLAGKLGGRGVWVSATRLAVERAIARNVFAKSLKTHVKSDNALADLVHSQLRHRVRQALSFAAKAGLVTVGFVKVEQLLDAGRARVLVTASDAADDGAARLARKYLAVTTALGRPAPREEHFTVAELSMAFGRTNVVHAALAEGGQTSAYLRESLRFERFRMNVETPSASPADEPSVGPSGLNTDKV